MAPKSLILRSMANGVVDPKGNFYPYKRITLSNGVNLAAKPNVAYYIWRVTCSIRLIAADTTTDLALTSVQYGLPITIVKFTTVPSAASSQNSTVEVKFTTDTSTALTCAAGTAAPTVGDLLVTYAEIEDVSGAWQQ